MSNTIVIKINDARLVVAGDGRILHVEPGFAVVDDGQVLTGHDAFANSRLMPRRTSDRHWSDLSAEAGSAAVPGIETSAELAYAQLESLWSGHRDKADSVVLVVPSNFSSHALGVLLGIAQECGMPVTAMVDAAVAASTQPYPGSRLLYVDAGLHGVTVTPIEQGAEASSLDPQVIDTGLASLFDAFARRIAELFVLETRFDPLHDAESEQRLYDGMSEWLAALREDDSVNVEISHRGEQFAIELERRNLLGAGQGFFRALQQLVAQLRTGDGPLAVQLSDKIAAIPGVVDALARLDDAMIIEHEPGHAAVALLGAVDALASDGDSQIRLYRHLPWRQPAAVTESAPAVVARRPEPESERAPAPTHVVYQGIAYAINGAGVAIGRSAEPGRRTIVVADGGQGVSRTHCVLTAADGELRLKDVSRYGTFVNERRIEGETALRPADVIRVGSPGAELTAIRLAATGEGSDDGA